MDDLSNHKIASFVSRSLPIPHDWLDEQLLRSSPSFRPAKYTLRAGDLVRERRSQPFIPEPRAQAMADTWTA